MIKKKSAFTLIEVIIVLSITVLVLGIVMSVFMTGNRVFAQSDVKTTLQMQGKDIQEKISNICMEGSKIEAVTRVSTSTDEIKSIKILSFYNNGSNSKSYEIKLNDDSNLDINGNILYGKVKSIKINKNIVDESKKIGAAPDYTGFSSIDFNIVLTAKKGFSGELDYLVNFTVAFRNKGK
ncbi:PilW family protein [Clostridium butyricum]|jgi:type II secretory pathway pseudopilin PulG|uniref:PilW family protein n=1 Tax=Clostridium butyricum TaxID=1492 RepID=UPI0029046CA4|nr:type II secretion system protein [Clostridium butyricum]MDU4799580.1 type II secretion system protein [Clostridium butyricum]